MSRFEGLKNREIAQKLNISTTAVEKHISKAMLRFSERFRDEYSFDIYIIVIAWLIEPMFKLSLYKKAPKTNILGAF